MILFIMCMRDRSADVFGQPSFHLSVGGAVRGFGDEINRVDANNVLNRHPEDFDLYQLGTYDDSDGSFNIDKPRQVAIGKDLIRNGK